MIIQKFENELDWKAARLGKITGSRLKDIVVKRGTGKKKGFYELIAERIGFPADDEKPMDRGHRLEEEAIDRFIQATEKKVDVSLVIWSREEDPSIAISPDGMVVSENADVTEAVEVKCLASASHIEALLTQEIPDEYHYQVLQYFVCNDKLEKLHFCFYDPRLKVKDFFIIEVTRDQLLSEIETMLISQRETLAEVETVVNTLLAF